VISVRETAEDVRKAIDAGAMGYIPKSSTPEVMMSALQLVLSGGIYLPPHLLQELPAGNVSAAENGNDESDGCACDVDPIERPWRACVLLLALVAGAGWRRRFQRRLPR